MGVDMGAGGTIFGVFTALSLKKFLGTGYVVSCLAIRFLSHSYHFDLATCHVSNLLALCANVSCQNTRVGLSSSLCNPPSQDYWVLTREMPQGIEEVCSYPLQRWHQGWLANTSGFKCNTFSYAAPLLSCILKECGKGAPNLKEAMTTKCQSSSPNCHCWEVNLLCRLVVALAFAFALHRVGCPCLNNVAL